jgi:hypothetical protein
MGKKGIVDETMQAAYEVDAHRRAKEVQEGVDAEGKIAELNKQKREATIPLDGINLENESLGFLEGYTLAFRHLDKAKEMLSAVSLYYICKRKLYTEKGFASFADYCKARGLCRSVAYEWVKNIEDFGIKDFSALTEKIGLNKNFFREVKALPEEFKNAAVKGEKIELNGKEYDLSKDGKELRDIVKALVHEVNLRRETRGAYETHKQWNEKIAKKENEIKHLREQLDDKNLPLEDRAAIQKIHNLKIQLCGCIRLLESADLKKYSEEVKEELLLTAQYAYDRGQLFLGRVLDHLKGDRPALEEAEENFLKKWDKDEA